MGSRSRRPPASEIRKSRRPSPRWRGRTSSDPAPGNRAFRRGVAGTELVTVPAAGHMVIVEKAESVVAALARLD
jgi:pimeloyl-ACP methyl ester carboxylesterase